LRALAVDASVCRTDARKTTAEAEWSARPQQNLQREETNASLGSNSVAPIFKSICSSSFRRAAGLTYIVYNTCIINSDDMGVPV